MVKYIFIIGMGLFFNACTTSFNGTGFLASYEGLSAVPSSKMHYFYKTPDVNLSGYTKILIPDIQVIPSSKTLQAYDHKLYRTVSAYTTASYRKILMKNSANYTVVDVAQKETLVMSMAISLVVFPQGAKDLDKLSMLSFKLDEHSEEAFSASKARLMIEVKTTDAMNNKLLARSVHVMVDHKIHAEKKLRFTDIQTAIDAWLAQTIRS